MIQIVRTIPLQKNTILNDYVVLGILGQGGFGTSYLCKDTLLDRQCVIKEFTPHHLVHRTSNNQIGIHEPSLTQLFTRAKNNFLDEARTLAKFNHPNIVKAIRYFEENNTAYIVMAYEPGRTLHDVIQRQHGTFTESEIENIFIPLCDGLAELHAVGIIHRDVKPANIIIKEDGSLVLIDFGAAADLWTQSGDSIEVVATPRYAPVEQFDSKLPQGAWIDIYAIGATMYELISGNPPQNALDRIEKDDLIPACRIGNGTYSHRLLSLIDRCLVLGFRNRPESIEEFMALYLGCNIAIFKEITSDISLKGLRHFMNWATPNPGLCSDELAIFLVCFPIIDLSWRIDSKENENGIKNDLFSKRALRDIEFCYSTLKNEGFTTQSSSFSIHTIEARLKIYTAAYLLDRQEDVWKYDQVLQQCAKHCLTKDANHEKKSFMELLGDVIDRMRGRVKKGFRKKYDIALYKTSC